MDHTTHHTNLSQFFGSPVPPQSCPRFIVRWCLVPEAGPRAERQALAYRLCPKANTSSQKAGINCACVSFQSIIFLEPEGPGGLNWPSGAEPGDPMWHLPRSKPIATPRAVPFWYIAYTAHICFFIYFNHNILLQIECRSRNDNAAVFC